MMSMTSEFTRYDLLVTVSVPNLSNDARRDYRRSVFGHAVGWSRMEFSPSRKKMYSKEAFEDSKPSKTFNQARLLFPCRRNCSSTSPLSATPTWYEIHNLTAASDCKKHGTMTGTICVFMYFSTCTVLPGKSFVCGGQPPRRLAPSHLHHGRPSRPRVPIRSILEVPSRRFDYRFHLCKLSLCSLC